MCIYIYILLNFSFSMQPYALVHMCILFKSICSVLYIHCELLSLSPTPTFHASSDNKIGCLQKSKRKNRKYRLNRLFLFFCSRCSAGLLTCKILSLPLTKKEFRLIRKHYIQRIYKDMLYHRNHHCSTYQCAIDSKDIFIYTFTI